MPCTINDYCDVLARSRELNLNEPTGIALLPRNDAGANADLLHEASVQTIRSLFRQNKIVETPIEKAGQKIPVILENDSSLILPILFVSASIYSQNPQLVSIALNIMSNYATDFFKGIRGRKTVKLTVVVQNKNGNSNKRISYEGTQDGLKEIAEIAGKVFRDEK
jgi:hypothetical protein